MAGKPTPSSSRRTDGKKSAIAPFQDPEVELSLFGAAEVGIKILRKYHRKLHSIEKKGAVDLVTQADKEAEQKVFSYLRKRHKGHAFIGEETWDGSPAPAGYAWILDPVDGTTNYAHGLDHYGFSLGVVYDGEPVAGLILDPSRNHVYHAFKGRGAWRDKDRLHVSTRAKLIDSLVGTGFSYDRNKRMPQLLNTFGAFLTRVRDLRRFGVASLDLALVAAGQFDGYFEDPLHAWDVAAGILLVTEAGGKVTDYNGNPVDLFKPGVVASNGIIHPAMLKVIRESQVAKKKA